MSVQESVCPKCKAQNNDDFVGLTNGHVVRQCLDCGYIGTRTEFHEEPKLSPGVLRVWKEWREGSAANNGERGLDSPQGGVLSDSLVCLLRG